MVAVALVSQLPLKERNLLEKAMHTNRLDGAE